jgi:hypothetical protein
MLFVLLALFDCSGQTRSNAPLNNKDITELVRAGLSTEVIIEKIKTSPSNFDTSPAALRELKTANVPDQVILAMVQAQSRGDEAPADLSQKQSAPKAGNLGEPKPSNLEALSSAKSLYITTPEGSNPELRTSVEQELVKWHKLALVSSKEEADLILTVEVVRGYSPWKGRGARGTALLTDRRFGMELWSTSEGGDWSMSGFSIGKVGRKIADNLIKFYDAELKQSSSVKK